MGGGTSCTGASTQGRVVPAGDPAAGAGEGEMDTRDEEGGGPAGGSGGWSGQCDRGV